MKSRRREDVDENFLAVPSNFSYAPREAAAWIMQTRDTGTLVTFLTWESGSNPIVPVGSPAGFTMHESPSRSEKRASQFLIKT